MLAIQVIVFFVFVGMTTVSAGRASARPGGSEIPKVAGAGDERCDLLKYADFSAVDDAPTEVTASEFVQAAGGLPSFCRVRGYVAPNTGFELRLPTTAWNGKFFYAGCTGHCGIAGGSSWTKECDYPLIKGYACIVSDLGHIGSPSDGLWAYRNLDAKVDFAFRATHRSAESGKAITQAFYESVPDRSYYMGCSTGGRQGLVSAQRFPWDFDGIIVGAPVVSQAGTSMDFIWNLQAMADDSGAPVFSMEALKLLHESALKASDADDGLTDGVIGDPRSSTFDPQALLCSAGQNSDCLTAAQVSAAEKIYMGPASSQGRKLYPGAGLKAGSEAGWSGFFPAMGDRGPAGKSGIDSMRYMVTDWGPDWKTGDFDFDRDYKRLGEGESLYSAGDPDLREFKAAGGKLMLYQGWADPIIAPMNSVDYYELVERTMGGRAQTEDFFRLFMVPGMNHCFGGKGAFAIDYITAMEAWVEEDIEPDMLEAAHLKGEHDASSMIRVFPMDRELQLFTRPVFPYPYRARYRGAGDPDRAASFDRVAGQAVPGTADRSP